MAKYTIKKIHEGKNGVKEKYKTNKGEMTVAEAVKKIKHGDSFQMPGGGGVHSVDGRFLRSNPNNKEDDNIDSLPRY